MSTQDVGAARAQVDPLPVQPCVFELGGYTFKQHAYFSSLFVSQVMKAFMPIVFIDNGQGSPLESDLSAVVVADL